MKKPTVDYRQFRLGKINQPEFSHLKLLLGWPAFFIMFFLTERLIPAERCTSIHCALDEFIPFCEFFVVPYVLWYALIAFSLAYFLMYDVESFKKLQSYIIFLQAGALLIYILFPSRQDLRPELFSRDNLFTDMVSLLYTVDTNTGVCPSLHCAISMAIASVWRKARSVPRCAKNAVAILCLLICMSTMFIKQHSFLDFLAAIPLCIAARKFILCRNL